MLEAFMDTARWYALAVKWEARDTWRALPGPWWVKVAIIIGCLAIPGELDEIALLAVLKLARARKAREAGSSMSTLWEET